MITYKKGDIIEEFKKGYDVMCHQCNCFNVMGAGVAKIISKEFPQAFLADKEMYQSGLFLYGNYSIAKTEFGNIANLYGQYHLGPCQEDFINIDSYPNRIKNLKEAFGSMLSWESPKTILMPLMGSGIAADPKLKEGETDLTYFKSFIAPFLKSAIDKQKIDVAVTVMYL